MGQGRRINDGVCGRELMRRAEIGGRQRDRRIEIGDDAGFGEGDHLIGLILPHLALEPLREFQLHDGRHQPLPALGVPEAR